MKKNKRKRKRIYELIIVVVLIGIAGGMWWRVSTRDQRQADAQFERLVKFANRQQVEIAVIKQAAELRYLKTEIQKAQQPPAPPLFGTIDPE